MNISSYIHFPQAEISLSEHEDIPARVKTSKREKDNLTHPHLSYSLHNLSILHFTALPRQRRVLGAAT